MKSKGYEILFIIQTNFSEAERQTITDNLQNILTKAKASIIEFKDLGLKDFAMELKKEDQGYYYQLRFIASQDQLELLQEDLKVNEKIFRHLIVTLDSILTKEEYTKIV
tara:strand:- start:343 stop:669 length:327 start_codon:yes stop_codon:yes gene_type:complete